MRYCIALILLFSTCAPIKTKQTVIEQLKLNKLNIVEFTLDNLLEAQITDYNNSEGPEDRFFYTCIINAIKKLSEQNDIDVKATSWEWGDDLHHNRVPGFDAKRTFANEYRIKIPDVAQIGDPLTPVMRITNGKIRITCQVAGIGYAEESISGLMIYNEDIDSTYFCSKKFCTFILHRVGYCYGMPASDRSFIQCDSASFAVCQLFKRGLVKLYLVTQGTCPQFAPAGPCECSGSILQFIDKQQKEIDSTGGDNDSTGW